MRMGISRDLGFTAEERSENLRRSAEVAKLINDAGLICIAAFVAPSEEVRQRAARRRRTRSLPDRPRGHAAGSLPQRDAEGAYAKADSGEIANFPGVSAPYEEPAQPDLVLHADQLTVEQCVDRIMALLAKKRVVH